MDFLSELPKSEVQLADEDLHIWQRKVIFECECENLINRCNEDAQPDLTYDGHLRDLLSTAVDFVVQNIGLHAEPYSNGLQLPRGTGRPCLQADAPRDLTEEALSAAIEQHGLKKRDDPS